MWTVKKYLSFVSLILALSSVSGVLQAEPALGESFRDCAQCPLMQVVAPGSFVMGDDDGYKYERPAHRVTIDYAFALGVFEVTFDEWEACAQDGACKSSPDDHGWGKGRFPIINVTYEDIGVYLDWLSNKTGHRYRLPSEAEWEYAARAGTTTAYWWGDDVGKGKANCRKCGSQWSGRGSAPVGSFDPNPWGFYDMHGNAWEWVADCWTPNHQGAPADGRVRRDGNCKTPVTRGGSWYYFPKLSRSAYRYKNARPVFSYNISFRVLREME